MNVENRPLTIYPKFHDTHEKEKKIDTIDHSIYHLLSLYLNVDSIVLDSNIKSSHKSTHFSYHNKRNWFGENQLHHQSRKNDILLHENTIKNTHIQCIPHHKKKKNSIKSVSFNETVTIISSKNNISNTSLDKEDDDDIFVDALESL